MLKFFRENKLVAAVFIISFLFILFCLALLMYSKQKVKEQEQAQLQSLTRIAVEAQAQLQSTVVQSDQPIADIIPEESLDRVAAMEDKNPAPGTADWCEVMMVKPSKEWTSEEQQTFAQHCI